MRNIPPRLQHDINSGATTLCYIWRLTRADDVVLGFTDHDEDLLIDGVTFSASSGISGGDTEASLGFAMDNGHIQSIFSDGRIAADDIYASLYDRAELSCDVVNWADLTQRVPLTRGYLGEIKQAGESFTAEWVGESAKLDRAQGRVLSRLCDADFGDQRCGLKSGDFAVGTSCPRSYAACRDRFSNTHNFRGFPYLLGDDALMAAPQESDLRDGGSRYGNTI